MTATLVAIIAVSELIEIQSGFTWVLVAMSAGIMGLRTAIPLFRILRIWQGVNYADSWHAALMLIG
jgi:hypothetical protein